MAKFILGYEYADTDFTNLKQFATKTEADFETEEWVEVEAENFEQAKAGYEAAFAEWKAKGEIK